MEIKKYFKISSKDSWKNHIFLEKIVSVLDLIKIIWLLLQYWGKYGITVLLWRDFCKLNMFLKFLIFTPKKIFSLQICSQCWYFFRLYSKHFPENQLIWNLNSRFGSKIIFSEVRLKGVGVVIWYLSIPPHNNSRAVVKNLRILVYRSSLRLTIPYLKLNIVTSHHQVVSIF